MERKRRHPCQRKRERKRQRQGRQGSERKRERQEQPLATRPSCPKPPTQDKEDVCLAAKYNYTKQKPGQDNKDNDDAYEVYCSVCGELHKNTTYKEGHCCRFKKHKSTPCKGVIVLTRPKPQEDGEEEEEDGPECEHDVSVGPNSRDANMLHRNGIVV